VRQTAMLRCGARDSLVPPGLEVSGAFDVPTTQAGYLAARLRSIDDSCGDRPEAATMRFESCVPILPSPEAARNQLGRNGSAIRSSRWRPGGYDDRITNTKV